MRVALELHGELWYARATISPHPLFGRPTAVGQAVQVALLIDTGASDLVLPPNVIQDLKLGYQEKVERGTADGDARIQAYDGVHLDIVGKGIDVARVLVSKVCDKKLGPVGVAGWDVLQHFTLVIDGPNGSGWLEHDGVG